MIMSSSEGAILKIINQASKASLKLGRLELRLPIGLANFARVFSEKIAPINVPELLSHFSNIFEMSDVYKATTIISLGDCPNTHLSYVLKQRESGNEVVFWLKIKLETLASWRRDILSF